MTNLPAKTINSLILPDRAIPKADIPAVAKQLCDTLGEFTDALTRQVMLKQAENIIKEAYAQVMDDALAKMEGNEMEVFGATIKTRHSVEYDYNDPLVREYEQIIESTKKKLDEHKKFLRTLKTGMVDPHTGEIFEPPKKIKDGQTLVISFK